MRPLRCCITASLAVTVACAPDDTTPAYTSRDSAGFRIVDNSRPYGPQPALVGNPIMDLGYRPDEPAYDMLRVSGAYRLPGGRVVVYNGRPPEMRLFDEQGRLVRTAGHQGHGPGEFEGLLAVEPGRGDSLFGYDYQLRRLNRFASDAKFVDAIPLTASLPWATLRPLGRLADGTWLAQVSRFLRMDAPDGLQRDTGAVVRLAAGLDSILDTLSTFLNSATYVAHAGTADHPIVSVTSPPFAITTTISARHERVAIGDAAHAEVRVIADGAPPLLIRWAGDPIPLPDARFEEARTKALGQASGRFADMLASMWDAVPPPESYPRFATVMLDRLDRLWVIGPEIDGADSASALLFDREGRWLTELRIPARFTPTDAGANFLLGIRRDEDDVEHIQLFRLSGS